jgi:hypothetical protein
MFPSLDFLAVCIYLFIYFVVLRFDSGSQAS